MLSSSVLAGAGSTPPAVKEPRFREAIVVLGAAIDADGTPSPGLVSRLEEAARAAAELPHAAMVLSGGGSGPEPEAHAMARWLLQRGVAPERLVLEARSHNTRSNMLESVPILSALGVERVHLLTEGFHMKRARTLMDMALRQNGLGRVALHTRSAPTQNLGAAARESPSPRRDVSLMAREWRSAPRPALSGEVRPPRALLQGVAAALEGLDTRAFSLPSSE